MTIRKDTSDPRASLEHLGWRASFEQAMAPFRQEGLVPARVIAEHRGMYRVASDQGEMPAEVTGRLIFHAEERLDYPVVGDWVAAAVLDQGGLAVIHQTHNVECNHSVKCSRRVSGKP